MTYTTIYSRSKGDLVKEAKAAGHSFDEARMPKSGLALLLTGHKVIRSKFAGHCAQCGEAFPEGAYIQHDPTGDKGHKAMHCDCAGALLLEAEGSSTTTTTTDSHKESAAMETTTTTDLFGETTTATVKSSLTAAEKMAAALAEMAAGLTAKPTMDAEQIRELVRAEVSKMPSTKVDIIQNGETVKTFEGLHHPALPTLIKILSVPRVNVWMAGAAGSGKTTLAQQAAEALGFDFYMNGALLAKHEVSGFVDAGGRIISTPFRDAWTNGGLYLHDEADGSSPAAFLAMNAALAGGLAEFAGETKPVPRHANFRCIVAANTWGAGANADYVGRNKIDAATLNRFVFLPVDYCEHLERAAAGNDSWVAFVQKMRAAARSRGKRLIISPRASIYGAQLLAAGLDLDTVKGLTLFNNMSAEDRRDLEAA